MTKARPGVNDAGSLPWARSPLAIRDPLLLLILARTEHGSPYAAITDYIELLEHETSATSSGPDPGIARAPAASESTA